MRLYNTLTRSKEEFVPLEEGKIRMYACGPTVYNQIHLGNARALVLFDLVRRYLEYSGYKVTFVQNFTDVDDKMIQRAEAENTTISELADKYIEEYFQDADGLAIKRATLHPKATQTIDAIIDLIRILEERGFAYETDDGVYFDVLKDPDYGKLSNHKVADLLAGAGERVAVDEQKRNPVDFALWKKKKPGEPSWESPWGDGRPAWHIECSAMIRKHLDDTIDIHCGGQDLTFPHHENEIAQSESATGKPFVRYWIHNGFITVDEEKMSKSTGNFFTVRDIAAVYPYSVIRFFLLSSHYRMPINYSMDLMDAAQRGLQRVSTCLENLDFAVAQRERPTDVESDGRSLIEASSRYKTQFVSAMNDDLNTADALASIFELVRAANTAASDRTTPAAALKEAASTIRELCEVLGVTPGVKDAGIPDDIEQMVQQRTQAKSDRDFATADALRDQIRERGYVIEDTSEGPRVLKE